MSGQPYCLYLLEQQYQKYKRSVSASGKNKTLKPSAKPYEEDSQEKCHKGSDALKISGASYILVLYSCKNDSVETQMACQDKTANR